MGLIVVLSQDDTISHRGLFRAITELCVKWQIENHVTGRVQQLDTVACAPRSMADSTFPCERKRWAYALPDNWQRLLTPSRHARRSSFRKGTDPEGQDAAKVDQRNMAR